jgi:hypothetical protein
MHLVATYQLACQARHDLFSTEQALALLPALDRFTAALAEHRLPFPVTLLQFTTPIAEADLLPYPEILPDPVAVADDRILALLLSQDETQEGALLNTAGAWFQSGAVNRVAWPDDPHADLRLPDPDAPNADHRLANKIALRATGDRLHRLHQLRKHHARPSPRRRQTQPLARQQRQKTL